VRLLTNITQSLIRSYTQTKGAAPVGETRTFLEEHMPFGGAMAAWLAYTREHIGEEAFNKVWEKSVSGEKARGGPTKSLSGKQDYLDFSAKPAFDLMIKYYTLPEGEVCNEMRPEALLAFVDAELASASAPPQQTGAAEAAPAPPAAPETEPAAPETEPALEAAPALEAEPPTQEAAPAPASAPEEP
jgi:hypothetical protein